jgi:hypothetical protein
MRPESLFPARLRYTTVSGSGGTPPERRLFRRSRWTSDALTVRGISPERALWERTSVRRLLIWSSEEGIQPEKMQFM